MCVGKCCIGDFVGVYFECVVLDGIVDLFDVCGVEVVVVYLV